jgi:hypothetical protein
MSKERELLKRWFSEFGKIYADIKLLRDTQTLLAQPEQEPVAWMYDWKTSIKYDGKVQHVVTNKNFLTLKMNHAVNEVENIRPLYLVSQTRKPLSEAAVDELLMGGFSTHLMDLVRMVEKAHGIGVDDE